ncbi:hypothetical protein M404DRAFT_600110 [Pisolithus tinctorius Marx 270]|uniref:Uncharacterized protein n=1 Tax=Pisolithus tinctorius Marx 270 TaxID=870435 RepID=A0A0C3J4Q0_PISTI|nr:hypothetical protein M404DRAFT_600110 [Pisolithus tinctorius Marx 270]
MQDEQQDIFKRRVLPTFAAHQQPVASPREWVTCNVRFKILPLTSGVQGSNVQAPRSDVCPQSKCIRIHVLLNSPRDLFVPRSRSLILRTNSSSHPPHIIKHLTRGTVNDVKAWRVV